jgi:hypothetical protein
VNDDQYMLKDAAKDLGINYSTAKTIVRIWRNENRIFKKYASNPKKKRSRDNTEDRTRYTCGELKIASQVNVNMYSGKLRKPLTRSQECFTIGGNNDMTNCSNEIDYGRLLYSLVYCINLAQKGIEEFQIQQNKIIIRHLLSMCESLFNSSSKYNVFMLCGNSQLSTSYYNLICNILLI